MNIIKKTGKFFLIIINLVLMYFILSGIYGYVVAVSLERKEKWLLASLFWVALLIIINLICFVIRLLYRKKQNALKKKLGI